MSSPVVIDVGANRGQSIDSFRFLLPECVIHAIEPNPLLAGWLAKRYVDVSVHPCAMGATAGNFTLYVPRYGFTHWDTRASLDRGAPQEFLSCTNFWGFRSERAHIEAMGVPVSTLDSLELVPDVLKIDAEGLEAEVLSGAKKTLEWEPIIFVEGNDRGVFDVLVPLGYTAFHAEGEALARGPGTWNTFFLKEKHRELVSTREDSFSK
ncbi:MAG: FkbM family methyltransferase [Pseudomonadota bacterium]